MRALRYERAASLEQAVEMSRSGGRSAAFLNGGQSLIRDRKRNLRSEDLLIDIGGALGGGIRALDGMVEIEAGATHAEVASSDVVAKALPMLAAMVSHIADPAVRNRATIGGSFASNEPAGDYPAAALALGARIRTDRRTIDADDFFLAEGGTALAGDELVVAVSFPAPCRAAYVKILNPAARYAMVGVCAAVDTGGTLRLAVTGASAGGAFRWTAAEQALADDPDASRIRELAVPTEPMRSDLFADADYRGHLMRIMATRAVEAMARGVPVEVYSHGAPLAGRPGPD